MTNIIIISLSFLVVGLGICMHSAYKLGYINGYRRAKLLAQIVELERKQQQNELLCYPPENQTEALQSGCSFVVPSEYFNVRRIDT